MKIYIISILSLLTASPNFAQQEKAKIMVSPNVLVSKDGKFTHVEYMLAANPKDPDNLICNATIFPEMGYYVERCKSMIYETRNGGKTWDYNFNFNCGFGDPEIDFTNKGTVITASLGNVLRSEDGGKTWNESLNLYYRNKPFVYGMPVGQDHPQLVTDQTFGNYSGRIYISGMGGSFNLDEPKQNTLNFPLWLIRSEDDGKSFIGPVLVTDTEKGKGLNTTNLLVSSKGTLFFTYVEWFSDKSLPGYFRGYNMYLITSKDGGITFSSPHKIGATYFDSADKSIFQAFPQYAIDNRKDKYVEYLVNYNGQYKDRIYCVYSDCQNEKLRVMLTYSKDGGESWSIPKLVDPNMPQDAIQYKPSVAVNSNGVVGIRWFDTRGGDYKKEYNEYFTASLDGGETFLPPVKVSAEASKLPFPESERIIPIWSRSEDRDSIFLVFKLEENFTRRRIQGDYTQFTVDARGVFHDIWSDNRYGNHFQLYTSAIKVIGAGEDAEKERIAFEKRYNEEKEGFNLTPKKRILKKISKEVFLNMDAIDYDTVTNVLSIPVRVRNISDKPIFGPIKLEISKIDTSKGPQNVPSVINADNNKKGRGAIFNFQLKGLDVLLPESESETKILKFKVVLPASLDKLQEEGNKILESNRTFYINRIGKSDLHISVMGYAAVE